MSFDNEGKDNEKKGSDENEREEKIRRGEDTKKGRGGEGES